MDEVRSDGGSSNDFGTAMPGVCTHCGGHLSVEGRFCPSCGQAQSSAAPGLDEVEVAVIDLTAEVEVLGPEELTVADILDAAVPAGPVVDIESELAGIAPRTGDTLVVAAATPPTTDPDATLATEAVGATEVVVPAEPLEPAPEALTAAPVVTDEPLLRSRARRLLIPIGVAVTVAVVVAAVALFVSRDSGPSYDLDAALTAANERVASVWADADRAGTLAQLQAVGRDAGKASDELDRTAGEFAAVGNESDRTVASAALRSYVASLTALVPLAELDAAKTEDWPQVTKAVSARVAKLRDAEANLAERGLPAPADLADGAEAAAAKLDVAIEGIAGKLWAWADETKRITADRHTQTMTLSGYTDKFRAELDKYAGLRIELGNFTDRLLNEGVTYSEAYSFMGGAAARRQEVHAAMSAAQPPAVLVAAHTAIISAVSDSITAVQSGIQGVEQYQYGYYSTVQSTPGWQTFTRISRQISDTYSAAVSNWDAAVATEEARIKAITTPTRPAV